ncbi:4-hydroxy-3-methylbut-2-enyl diphosphate reductase [Arcanobacterium phocisimile]|uniref:4-hydroxy-3-methylbut-2-enyl diphosphate reductase n=1 Tax=Arcanobacterium phocisimile TaxID=1302235 RepID=UPI003B82F42A
MRIEENSGNTGTVSLAGASAFPADIASEPNAEGKRILIATPRGYCAGVDRAVDTVEKALELYDPPVYVRKEIVHNKFVVETLMKRGAIFVHDTDEVPEGARVVFSAHGVSPAVQEAANRRMLQTIDATCPLVTKVHKQAVRFADQDYDILLIGHIGHEEVEGTQGEAPDHIQVVNGPEDVANVQVRDPDRVVWISQTTLSVDETMKTVELLRKRFPNLMNPPSDDICYATQNRQGSVKEMAPDCDVVIVVGSANSSNSVRLVEVALEGGARAAYRVDKADELQREWVEGNLTIGVTSGASVPEILVRDVVDQLKEWGFTSVEPVFTVHEDVHFSLPKNLRGELKATGVEVDRPHKARAKGASRRSTARSTGRLASDEDSDSSLA